MSGVRYICGGADHPHRHLILCKRQYNCGDADLSQRHFLCKRQYKRGNTDLSQRHLLCKRQYNCGDTDLSQRHLLCKRQYNCGNTDLSQRHLLCKRQNNCGDTDLSQRHLLCKHQYNSDDQPAAATAATIRATAPSGSSAYCACHTKARRGHGGDYPRRSSFRKLCVLRLPRKSEPRPRRRLSAPQLLQEAMCTAPANQKRAAATAATIRAAAPSGSSAYCACHTKARRGHGGDYPRHSSFRKLCVLRLPRKSAPRPRRRLSAPQLLQEALCTVPATQKRVAATAATIRAAAPSGSSAYCACHAKARRGHGGDYPRHTFFRQLCVLRLPRKSEPRPQRRLSAPQLLQEALRTAPATQKRAAATAATIRAAAPSGSSAYCACHAKARRGHGGDYPRRSVYCACHAKASRGHGGDYPRRSSFRKLCVLHLPRKSESRPRRRLSAPHLLQAALRTAPATQKRAAATAATIRAAAPSGSSAYCACHAKASRGHGGDYPRHTFFRQLCVLRLPRKSEPRPRRRLSAPQLLQEALRTAPATQKRAAATAATIRAAAPEALCTAPANPRRSSFKRLRVLRLSVR